PVFVAGPGTGDMVVEQEELVSFDRDRTTRHELEGIHPVAEESGEGLSIDAFGESTRGTGPVPGFMDEDGVPAGWGNTGELEELPKDVSGGPDPGDRATDSPELAAVYRHLESLGTSEKQRLAKGGNRTVRGLLVKDRMKNLHQFVFRNPKITLEEVMEYARLPGLSKEAIRIIASDRTWMASLQVVLALVRNPGTPTELLSGLIQRLGPAHWRVLARSGDVRSQVATLAKKLLLASGS
ncbi:MAG: hypothetical protein FJ098_15300, partial [Deltaproteobacteria bacterium]|nr:hypothetical protein [Deltaproteobacteria bacterium]